MTIPAASPVLNRSNRPSARYIGMALAIILFGLALQLNCLHFQKVIDDNDLIYAKDQRGWDSGPLDSFRNPVFQLYYRPLFTATFALGARLHSQDTIWYHLENMALHAVVGGLAFWFFFLLLKRERPALLAGLIFMLHPLQVTVTTFIGGRPDSMALFFLLLFSIGAWNATPLSSPNESGRPRFGWLALSVLGYAGAVFTKEQCLSLLLLLPLLLWRRGFAFPRRNVPWLALYLVPAVLYIAAASRIIPFATVPNPHWSAALHIEMIGRTLAYFERLLLFPSVGPIHQSTLGPWDVPQPGIAIVGYLIALIWVFLLWRIRGNPALLYCALWTTLTLLPCLNIIPIPSQFASCYRAVIPLLGLAGLFGAGLDAMLAWWQGRNPAQRPALGWVIVLSVASYYTWETVTDVPNWQNNHTLMLAEIYGDPNFVPAYHGLGFWAEMSGDWKEVDRQLNVVLTRILPQVPSGGSFAQAVDSPACQRNLWSQAGLRYHPHPYIQWLLPHRGWARQQQGHFAAASDDYRLTLLLNPNDDNSRANLRTCLMANGQVNEALSLYRNASEVAPHIDIEADRPAVRSR
jgi:hypothetical protein